MGDDVADWTEGWDENAVIKDPSHLKGNEARLLYKEWLRQQEKGKIPLKFLKAKKEDQRTRKDKQGKRKQANNPVWMDPESDWDVDKDEVPAGEKAKGKEKETGAGKKRDKEMGRERHKQKRNKKEGREEEDKEGGVKVRVRETETSRKVDASTKGREDATVAIREEMNGKKRKTPDEDNHGSVTEIDLSSKSQC